jgi:LysR family transcriptional regulator, glycine cleavage system transcriptional activator
MKRACPTIQELLAFDAVARHASLTRAASALCVSVSAISKQIAGLETFVGRPLLQKNGRGVELTPLGRDYLAKVSPSLRVIETATFEARAGSSGAGVIALASVPTFLTKWLIPRLPDFRRMNPGVTFSFAQHLGQHDALAADIDAAIRYGAGDWPGMRSDDIAGRAFVCVAAPELAPKRAALAPGDVGSHTLLHHEQAPLAWRHWAHHHGVDESTTLSGPRFAQYSAIIQACLSGLGIGLVPHVLVEEELGKGALVPVGSILDLEHGHYLCFDPARLDRPIFAAFRSWILGQSR